MDDDEPLPITPRLTPHNSTPTRFKNNQQETQYQTPPPPNHLGNTNKSQVSLVKSRMMSKET